MDVELTMETVSKISDALMEMRYSVDLIEAQTNVSHYRKKRVKELVSEVEKLLRTGTFCVGSPSRERGGDSHDSKPKYPEHPYWTEVLISDMQEESFPLQVWYELSEFGDVEEWGAMVEVAGSLYDLTERLTSDEVRYIEDMVERDRKSRAEEREVVQMEDW